MGLSKDFLDAHIQEWEQKLSGPAYPHREKWPSHLFHHPPLENAVSILTSGLMLSRDDSSRLRARDVAATGVIDHSIRAHSFVRLYFRPRTPTQYHVEGIQKTGDNPYSENVHAPVLVMFVFDSRSVLSSDEVFFSDANMQSGVVENSSEAFFRAIPFEKVYHEGGTGGDRSIITRRCAEVLAPSPLSLEGKLRWVYCRSEAERATLLQALSASASQWDKKIRISDDLKVFEKRFTFVEKVSLVNEGIIFRLNPRADLRPISVSLEARDATGRVCVRMNNTELSATPPKAAAWQVKAKLQPGLYRVVIRLEGHEAYKSTLMLDEFPF